MALEVELQNVSAAPDIPGEAQFQQWLDTLFAERDGQTVLLRIVDADESRQLNRDYRGKDYPTNVLSFPFDVPEGIPNTHLGDLVICAEVVAAQAQAQGKPLLHHWAHMLVHGVLHLLGHDHIDEAEAAEMEAIEIRLLGALAIPDPY